MDSSYITSAKLAHQLPDYTEPEFAFIGRSNVGKSSLLNALLARRGLAREGRTPGVTQMINFFRLNTGSQELMFADLPGYGFAKTAKDSRRNWVSLVERYFGRPNMAGYLFLMDCRRKLDQQDLDILHHLRAQNSKVFLILTKIDKEKRAQVDKARFAMEKFGKEQEFGEYFEVAAVSSLKKTGIDRLRDRLFEVAQQKKGD